MSSVFRADSPCFYRLRSGAAASVSSFSPPDTLLTGFPLPRMPAIHNLEEGVFAGSRALGLSVEPAAALEGK
jgi:hypothetical protein